MAPRKKNPPTPKNSGRATVRDVLTAVLGLNERIDDVNQRIDGSIAGQQTISHQMTELHTSMDKLEKTTNSRLHEMDADITALRRPWQLLASGWSKAIAVGGFSVAITGTAVRLEFWRFLPF